MIQNPTKSTLFPYTTLFRSNKMADTDKLVEQLSGLSVLEIAGLVKQLEEKWGVSAAPTAVAVAAGPVAGGAPVSAPAEEDRKSTRLNSSHRCISYAVFCLKK